MEDWAGFTDDDLRRMKGVNQKQTPIKGQQQMQQQKSKAENARKLRPKNLTGKPLPSQMKSSDNCLHPNQMLSAAKGETLTKAMDTNMEKTIENQGASQPSDVPPSADTKSSLNQTDTKLKSNESEMPVTKEQVKDLVTDDAEIISRETSSLQTFQQQQKMIEEHNKKKKIMLATAIQQRQKKAKAEAVKLSQIQRELNRLDQMVNEDVAIIRDKIEDASRDYLTAQKRYDRAEKEFIESKMDLHDKVDLKESLTEHLYTVIHQNELRKAKKLAELMSKLDMESAEDIEELKHFTIPNITLLNQFQVTYTQNPQSSKSPTSPGDGNSVNHLQSDKKNTSVENTQVSESKNGQTQGLEMNASKLECTAECKNSESLATKNNVEQLQSKPVNNNTEDPAEIKEEVAKTAMSEENKSASVLIADKEQTQ